MKEILDVVDEQDNIINTQPKDYCHKNKLLHRGAVVLIFKDKTEKEILVQKRSLAKKTNPGKNNFTGGHLNSGESYLEGAKRELQEELFFNHRLPTNLIFKEIFKHKHFDDNDYHWEIFYKLIYSGPFYPNPKEVDKWWFTKVNDLLKDVKTNPNNYNGTTRIGLHNYIANKA